MSNNLQCTRKILSDGVAITADVKAMLNFRRLRNIKRCNNFLTNHSTDVAQHSFYTTLLVMAVCDELNIKAELSGSKVKAIDTEIALRKSLIHDTDEAITSDIPYNVKNSSPELKKMLHDALGDISKQAFEGCSDILSWISHMSDQCKTGFEGMVVDLADMVELAMYCFEEVQSGNTFLKGLLDKTIEISKQRNIDVGSELISDILYFLKFATGESVGAVNHL